MQVFTSIWQDPINIYTITLTLNGCHYKYVSLIKQMAHKSGKSGLDKKEKRKKSIISDHKA